VRDRHPLGGDARFSWRREGEGSDPARLRALAPRSPARAPARDTQKIELLQVVSACADGAAKNGLDHLKGFRCLVDIEIAFEGDLEQSK
jgi:hypothetical protein